MRMPSVPSPKSGCSLRQPLIMVVTRAALKGKGPYGPHPPKRIFIFSAVLLLQSLPGLCRRYVGWGRGVRLLLPQKHC